MNSGSVASAGGRGGGEGSWDCVKVMPHQAPQAVRAT